MGSERRSEFIDRLGVLDRIRRNDDAFIEASFKTYEVTENFPYRRPNPLLDGGALRLADALWTNTRLLHLRLDDHHIGPEGARALASSLAHHPRIQSVSMSASYIGDIGAIAIAECMKTNRSIQKLDISDNEIGSEGGIAIANALSQNKHLKILNMSGNYLDRHAVEAFATLGLAHNSTLQSLALVCSFRFTQLRVTQLRVTHDWESSYKLQESNRKLERQDHLSIAETYIQVLKKSNITLKQLSLFGYCSSSQWLDFMTQQELLKRLKQIRDLDFYLARNELGQRSFDRIPVKAWPHVLASTKRRRFENVEVDNVEDANCIEDENCRILELNLLYHLVQTNWCGILAGYPLKLKGRKSEKRKTEQKNELMKKHRQQQNQKPEA